MRKEKELADYCRDIDPRFCGLKVLAFECAKDQMSAPKISVGRYVGFDELQVTRFFGNLCAVFEKRGLRPKIIFNVDESGIVVVPTKLPKMIAGKGGGGGKTPSQYCVRRSLVTGH
jgi:hypothetical protein